MIVWVSAGLVGVLGLVLVLVFGFGEVRDGIATRRRRVRVRVHLVGVTASIEGVLVRRGEWLEVAVPVVLESANDRHELAASTRVAIVHRDRLAWYEELQ